MITYLYWIAVISVALAALFFIGLRREHWKGAGITTCVIVVVGWVAYHFHFQNVFVKNWGGVMVIAVPDGRQHVSATWKDDNLWIENYDPKTNICHFKEYSKGSLLEGKVTIENCNPVQTQQ